MASSRAQQNKIALDHFIAQPVSSKMVSYLAQKASEVIRCGPTLVRSDKGLPPTPPTTPPPDGSRPELAPAEPLLPSVEEFIQSLVDRSQVQVPTLMSSLIYLARLKARLPPVAKGMRCTVHRIFLASLILAAKNLNDSSPKNKHWAKYTTVRGYEGFGFSLTEVNLMEKQLLFLLDWDLRIVPQDLYHHLEPFLAPICEQIQAKEARREARRMAQLREQELAAQRLRGRSPAYTPSASTISLPSYPAAYSFQQTYTPEPTPPSRVRRPGIGVGHTRVRSISPPSADAVPGLIREDSSTPSSRSSSISPPPSRGINTPASSLGAMEELPQVVLKPYNPYTTYNPCDQGLEEIVRGASHLQYAAYPMAGEETPAKKVKTAQSGGGLMSRFLASATGLRV